MKSRINDFFNKNKIYNNVKLKVFINKNEKL